jgi:Fe-S-cluster containining protein
VQWLADRVSGPVIPWNTGDFLEDGEWKCNKCGACCQDIRWIYPELASPDGRCKFYDSEDGCTIYEDRPWHCRSEHFRSDPMTEARTCAFILRYADERATDDTE